MGRLSGRVALVTGAGRGIGAATAKRLAEEGAKVTLADLDEEGCAQVAKEIESLGSEALPIRCDVSDASLVQATVDSTLERFGQLDILVNNAGLLRDNLIFKMRDDEWDRMLGVHLDAVLESLTPRERRAIQLRYGLLDGTPRTLEEVGKRFGVTRERVRQIEAKALRKMRHPSRSRNLIEFMDS